MKRDGGFKPALIDGEIQPQGVGGNDADIQTVKIQAAVSGESLESSTECGAGVLGRIEQNRASTVHGEGSQAWRARCHRDGHIESQPSLATFRLTSENSHSLTRPESFDEPAMAMACGLESRCLNHGERIRRKPAAGSIGRGCDSDLDLGGISGNPNHSVVQHIGIICEEVLSEAFIGHGDAQACRVAAGKHDRPEPGVKAPRLNALCHKR